MYLGDTIVGWLNNVIPFNHSTKNIAMGMRLQSSKEVSGSGEKCYVRARDKSRSFISGFLPDTTDDSPPTSLRKFNVERKKFWNNGIKEVIRDYYEFNEISS